MILKWLERKQLIKKTFSLLSVMIRKLILMLLNNATLVDFIQDHYLLERFARKSLNFLRACLAGSSEKGIRLVDFDGYKFKIFLNARNGDTDRQILALHVYEPKISELIRKYSNKDDVFVDVGANIGYHSLYASFFFKKVVAFEPLPSVFNQFKESIILNGITNIVCSRSRLQ